MPKGGWREWNDPALERGVTRSGAPAAGGGGSTTPKAQQTVRVQPTRAGKGGKTVTVIRGLELTDSERRALLKRLKGRIGSGGTLREDALELQGDRVDQAIALLEEEGFRPKRAGG
ncbi:translation initiation factor [Synechococcus sp. RSCCF101]|uniref:translation initiation factor n=1 Tax=Synechococcus sp. RSCCF101 TaxID=2511069 RepID=UPI001244E01A|nr:translation initiation factor [Synechococcus sp. RSCCF101]QEY32861.1 translation initiation factor [Synechococcus sp. RSCCF101]